MHFVAQASPLDYNYCMGFLSDMIEFINSLRPKIIYSGNNYKFHLTSLDIKPELRPDK